MIRVTIHYLMNIVWQAKHISHSHDVIPPIVLFGWKDINVENDFDGNMKDFELIPSEGSSSVSSPQDSDDCSESHSDGESDTDQRENDEAEDRTNLPHHEWTYSLGEELISEATSTDVIPGIHVGYLGERDFVNSLEVTSDQDSSVLMSQTGSKLVSYNQVFQHFPLRGLGIFGTWATSLYSRRPG